MPGAPRDTCQSGSCSENVRLSQPTWQMDRAHFFSLLSSCSFLPLSPSFLLLFLSSRNQQNKSSNIFHSAPGVVLNQQGKSTQWTRLLPPGLSLCLCDPGPVTFDHGAYWALLLSFAPFTLTRPPSSSLGVRNRLVFKTLQIQKAKT